MNNFKTKIAYKIALFLCITNIVIIFLFVIKPVLNTKKIKLHLNPQINILSNTKPKTKTSNNKTVVHVPLTFEKEQHNQSSKKSINNNQPVINLKNVSCRLLDNELINRSQTGNEKIAYLTFDDGPSNNTNKIIDILKKNNVKATFFVVGSNLDTSKLNSIINSGSIIGNHTYSHNYNYLYSNIYNFQNDINKLNEAVKSRIGKNTSPVFRFPGGSNNGYIMKNNYKCNYLEMIENLGYRYFDWNVSSTDAAPVKPSKETIINAVVPRALTKKKAVILMHDTNRNNTTVEALPEIIDKLSKASYRFDVLTNYQGEFENYLYLD